MLYEKYATLQLITVKTVRSTIMCDERTCLWFRKLITFPAMIKRVNNDADGCRSYQQYRRFSFAAEVFLLVFLVLFIKGLFAQALDLVWGLADAIIAAGSVFCMIKARHELAVLAGRLFELDGFTTSPGVTLYQVGEHYARTYGVPSLVSVIWVWDQRLRDVLLAAFVLAFGVYFLPSWKLAVFIVGAVILMSFVIKTWVMTRSGQ